MSNVTARMAAAGVGAGVWWVLSLSACGGATKAAIAPTTCPEGTVLKGDDCLPDSATTAKPSDEGAASTMHDVKPPEASPSPSGGAAVYDKEAVDAQLKRAAKQVKANCGSATDEDGNKTGPWGTTTATLVLGRNGHMADVSVPAPYSGKPVGDCVVRSFKKIQFPPYAGSSDVSVTWDVDIAEPKHAR